VELHAFWVNIKGDDEGLTYKAFWSTGYGDIILLFFDDITMDLLIYHIWALSLSFVLFCLVFTGTSFTL
jgi:hypothetical protein